MVLASMLLAGTLSAAPPSEAPPGGYWTLGEQRDREREPPDGEDELTVGSVVFSLGIIRAGAGALAVWMADRPDLCPVPADGTDSCASMRIYGWVGVGEGGLMIVTGIVYLAIGSTHRRRHQRWERGESLAQRVGVGPWIVPAPFTTGLGPRRGLAGGGLRLQLRF